MNNGKTNGDNGGNDSEVQVPEAKKSEFSGFLKTLASFTGDVASLTCPSFLLSGVSTLEYGQYWSDYPELFAEIPKADEEIQRIIAVFRWFVSTLYGSFASRKDKDKIEKKPFNPILGEQFLARWEDRNGCGETILFSEQVSHHPPVSAFYLENSKAGVSANGHTGQKSQFRATAARIDVIQVGHILVRMRDRPETYLITLPALQILGLWKGAPYVELSGNTYIRSENYCVTIEFTGKGWLSGEKHTFSGVVRRDGTKDPLFTASGVWDGKSMIENHSTKKKTLFFDVDADSRAFPIVASEEEQSPLESRRLWKFVAQAINGGDFSAASQLKGEIEQRQRDKVKRGEKTILQYFDWIEENPKYLALDQLNPPPDDERYRERGSWVYKKLSYDR